MIDYCQYTVVPCNSVSSYVDFWIIFLCYLYIFTCVFTKLTFTVMEQMADKMSCTESSKTQMLKAYKKVKLIIKDEGKSMVELFVSHIKKV